MTSAAQLWQDFLLYCEDRTPDDLLAIDFVRSLHTGRVLEAFGRKQAARELRTLQALLTWRERNTISQGIASTPETES